MHFSCDKSIPTFLAYSLEFVKLYHHETLVFSSNQLDIPRGHFGKKDSVRVSSMSQLLVIFETCCVILPTPSSDIRRAVSSILLMYIPCWAYIYIYSLKGFSKLLRDKISKLSSTDDRALSW